MKIYLDQGVNQQEVFTLQQRYGFDIIQHQSLEQNIKIADSMPGVFTLDQSMLDGGDYLAGDDVQEYEAIIGKSSHNDRIDTAHFYTAIHAGCDYFLTNNPKSFIYSSKRDRTEGKRKQLESVANGMKIVTTEEFKTELNIQRTTV